MTEPYQGSYLHGGDDDDDYRCMAQHQDQRAVGCRRDTCPWDQDPELRGTKPCAYPDC